MSRWTWVARPVLVGMLGLVLYPGFARAQGTKPIALGLCARDADKYNVEFQQYSRMQPVYRQNGIRAAVLAAVEVRDHVRKITGAALPIVPDRVRVRGARVLVGESAATRALGLRGEDFAKQEYLIRVQGDTLILMGRDARKPYGLMVRGAPESVAGKFGKALVLDGEQDAVVVEKSGFTDAQGSMEAWQP